MTKISLIAIGPDFRRIIDLEDSKHIPMKYDMIRIDNQEFEIMDIELAGYFHDADYYFIKIRR